MDTLYALILAGGRGTRFWPLSRAERPKQCISIDDDESYLAQTVRRLSSIIPKERILVVTGKAMEAAVRELLHDIPDENILVEPWGRNTAPSIGWGAIEIGKRCVGGIMAVFPCDHRIGKPEQLREVVLGAAQAVAATNAFVTLGIQPDRPETGFGYLEVGPSAGEWGGHTFHTVEQFLEKPDPDTAEAFLEGGRHLWNAGMFVFSVDGLRDAFRTHLPRSATALEIIAHDPSRLMDEWGNLDATSIDYGIMERSRHILTVPCDLDWSDMGSWTAVGDDLPKVPGGKGKAREIVAHQSNKCIVHAPGKVVALLGVEELVVVDTPDALLVMHASRSQQVGDIVRLLEDIDIKGLT
jgi:mannose-1-phosphate guanylyltransferase